MSFDKILFAFVIVLALTLNVGFVVGDIDDIGRFPGSARLATVLPAGTSKETSLRISPGSSRCRQRWSCRWPSARWWRT